MPIPDPTVDELVAALRRSALPTVVVEGKGDMPILRWVEERLGSRNANVQPAGGRGKLLSVYKRRQEFPNLPVAFVADRDMWLFSGIPSSYDGVIWTEGYSIENDLHADAELEKLLDPEETLEHQQLLDAIVEWFAFEIEEYLAKRCFKIAHNCNLVVPPGQTQMDDSFRKARGFRPPSEEIHQEISKAYQLKLRGKLLFQMLIRFLSDCSRHRKYSYQDLYKEAFGMTPPHPLRDRLVQKIERALSEQQSTQQHT